MIFVRFRKMFRSVVFVVPMFICSCGLADEGIDPNAMLARMHEVYAKAETYRATGIVETTIDFGDRTQNRIFSLDFGGSQNQLVGAWVYLNGKEFHLFQDVFGKRGVMDPGTPIVDVAKIDNVQQHLLLTVIGEKGAVYYMGRTIKFPFRELCC